ncbi:hypothetical protein B0H10DRAFT_2034516 [Mycena sp. CBHHK59/15]|nr:hypothetical protein B0H10DRAFT_2034516 [Mycena sp. CBHHK59/15]
MALGLVNTISLDTLRVETLLEITTHFQVPALHQSHVLSRVYLERLNTLRALSETAKRLHSGGWKHPLWSTDVEGELARALVRQAASGILSSHNTSGLSQPFERNSSSCIVGGAESSRSSSQTGAQMLRSKFFRCRRTYLCEGYKRIPSPLPDALQGCVLPTVRTLVLPQNAFYVVKSCPHVDHLKSGGALGHIFHHWEIVDVFPHLTEIPPLSTESLSPVRVLCCVLANQMKLINAGQDILRLLTPVENRHCITLVNQKPAREANGRGPFLGRPSTG